MPDRANKALLNPRYLLIALLPALVFSLSSLVATLFAAPLDIPPPRFAEFDVNKEGAARIGMLATFMLFAGAALAALFFFAYTLCMFDWRGRILPVLAFLAMAFAALLIPRIGEYREAHDFAGRSLACLAAGYDKAQSDQARRIEADASRAAPTAPPAPAKQAGSSRQQIQPDGVAVERLRNGPVCANPGFERMQSLGSWQFWGVVFSFAGLVIGAICCLATSPGRPLSGVQAAAAEPAPADGEALQHWERQAQWLNTYLYLTAFLLAAALLFINAYLRWPGYVLLNVTEYHGHVAALVSYYGIVFSIMLAAFYIPVATILAGKVKALKPAATGESELPHAFKGPFQILKIVLGLFSTALAGALPGIVGLIG